MIDSSHLYFKFYWKELNSEIFFLVLIYFYLSRPMKLRLKKSGCWKYPWTKLLNRCYPKTSVVYMRLHCLMLIQDKLLCPVPLQVWKEHLQLQKFSFLFFLYLWLDLFDKYSFSQQNLWRDDENFCLIKKKFPTKFWCLVRYFGSGLVWELFGQLLYIAISCDDILSNCDWTWMFYTNHLSVAQFSLYIKWIR